MKIGLIGLGRMGGNIARRLMKNGHAVVAYDRDAEAVKKLAADGAEGADSLDDMHAKLDSPAIWWVMVPAGEPTEQTVQAIAEKASAGDIIIDGGNSFYKDDVRRAKDLAEKGIRYVDVGTSGGVWGLERGYCMMIGGETETVDYLDPIFDTLAPGMGEIVRTPGRIEGQADPRAEKGYIHAGPPGAGHFVKMVHNGIEYGLMQAYAEGFDILKGKSGEHVAEDQRFDINLTDVAEVWRRGSVISSWLLDLSAIALAKDGTLEAPDAARRAHVDVADALFGKVLRTADVVLVEAVAAIDDDVALGGLFGDRLYGLLGRLAGGHHHPPDRGRVELAAHVVERVRADRAIRRELLHRLRIAIERDDLMAVLHQPARDIAAHPAEADQSDLHREILVFSLSPPERGSG